MAADAEAREGDVGGGDAEVAAAAAETLDYGAGEGDGEGRGGTGGGAGEGGARTGLGRWWHLCDCGMGDELNRGMGWQGWFGGWCYR